MASSELRDKKVFCLTDVPYIDVEALGSLMAKIFLDSIDQIVGHVVVIESEARFRYQYLRRSFTSLQSF